MKVSLAAALRLEYHKSNSRQNTIREYEARYLQIKLYQGSGDK